MAHEGEAWDLFEAIKRIDELTFHTVLEFFSFVINTKKILTQTLINLAQIKYISQNFIIKTINTLTYKCN